MALERARDAEQRAAVLAGAYDALQLSYDSLKSLFLELLRSPAVSDRDVEACAAAPRERADRAADGRPSSSGSGWQRTRSGSGRQPL